MTLIVYTQSRSFEAHIKSVVTSDVNFRSKLSPVIAGPGKIYLVHASSFQRELASWLDAASKKGAVIAVASDAPKIEDLLIYTQQGIHGYFNAYMVRAHYRQMLRLLSESMSWFPPTLLTETFDLARSAIQTIPDDNPLINLTKRERDVALAVMQGNSNKEVAELHKIAERTVKAHLTQVFKKLQVKDRVALVIYLNRFKNLAG